MTEDIQDMEDILSSIKSILEEDENKQAQSHKEDLDVDVLDDVLSTPSDDDILELSPDMMVSDDIALDVNSANETQDVVFNDLIDDLNPEEISPIDADTDDTNIVDMILSEDNDLDSSSNDEKEIEDPFIENITAVDDLLPNTQESDDLINNNIGEEPTIDFINDIIAESNQEEPVLPVDAINEETPVFEQASFSQDEFVEQDEVLNEVYEAIVPEIEDKGIDAFIQEHEISEDSEEIVKSSFEELDQQMPESGNIVEDLEIEPVEDISTASHKDTTDVSANIISNFAKMFSRDESQTSPSEEISPEITSVGNDSKTLEEFVLDSVVRVVGKEIAQQWNNGADFKTFAENEIIRQTKEWINDNLPSLVEKVVKQEIERVIAKVGS